MQHNGNPSFQIWEVIYSQNKLGCRKQLLAIKTTLEKWRRMSKGGECPFLILKNHQNLENVKLVKSLKSYQDRWSLQIQVPPNPNYYTSHKNKKANVLSRYHNDPRETRQSPQYFVTFHHHANSNPWHLQEPLPIPYIVPPLC